MPVYKAPLQDMRFVLNEVFAIEKNLLQVIPEFEEITPDLIDAILEEAGKICETLLAPLNQIGDQQGCRLEGDSVRTPDGFKQAYKTFIESGWTSLVGEPEYGGQGLPYVMQMLLEEMLSASNVSFSLYTTLSNGVYHGLHNYADEETKRLCLPKLVSGEWSGVMCLTEPQAGTDLGLIRTKAESAGDNTYTLHGTKIFITSGEHDLTENILHLVLARLPGAPEGVKGISLFLVPKFMVNSDGSVGERNAVSCGALEHKMGIKGSSTCVMNYEGAKGFLVGEPNRGLQAMFTIMNTERLAIGMEGVGLAEVSYQNAVAYARERLQGRAVDGQRQANLPADPIIVHPDVRRMLLQMRSFVEAARALTVWTSMLIDEWRLHPDTEKREQAADMVALVTPIVKALFTDLGFEACNHGLQVYGGHGYISEWGMEQFVRDARIAQIYEGANGIQALDLVGRKVLRDEGKVAGRCVAMMREFLEQHAADTLLGKAYIQPVTAALMTLEQSTAYLLGAAASDPNAAGAASSDYLRLFGLVLLGYMWARMAVAARNHEGSYYQAKLHTASFFMQRVLPQVDALAEAIKAGSSCLMVMSTEQF